MRFILYFFIFSIIWIAVFAESEAGDCLQNNRPCSFHSECCHGCCSKRLCVPYSQGCNKDDDPCQRIQCPPGKICYLQQVQCIQAPCPPIPACKPIDPDYN